MAQLHNRAPHGNEKTSSPASTGNGDTFTNKMIKWMFTGALVTSHSYQLCYQLGVIPQEQGCALAEGKLLGTEAGTPPQLSCTH